MQVLKAVIDFVMDILETIVFIGSLFIVIYLFIIQPNQVKGASMEPTFISGDYIFTSKITFRFRPPERGDVIVFKSPGNQDIEFIKRIIGLPGDKLLFKSEEVFVNGIQLHEDYISAKTNLWPEGFAKEDEEIVVPEGQLFVMGDNRPRSSDSREFGPIPFTSVIGHVVFRYFPSNKMGIIHNPMPNNLRSEIPNSHYFTQVITTPNLAEFN